MKSFQKINYYNKKYLKFSDSDVSNIEKGDFGKTFYLVKNKKTYFTSDNPNSPRT